MQDLELFIAGLVLVAAAETRFDTFVRLWNADLARAWEHEVYGQGWAFQQHGWGDFNRHEDDQ
jgi:hypothetical protein